jgi:Zn-dependent M28 family amino/carboxypeptidase
MKAFPSIIVFLFVVIFINCQGTRKEGVNKIDQLITESYVRSVIETLADDDMNGRSAMKPDDAMRAANYIEGEFKGAGLSYYGDLKSYRQEFEAQGVPMTNVIGMIKGKSKPDEFVIFSAHYDHVGVIQPVEGDSIANGADDDASGTTAVIALAKYFGELKDNERSLIFVTFCAEEIGGFGSRHFSQTLDPAKVVAMFNIEMIGKHSKWGVNTAFLTGFEMSNFGTILQKNVEATAFKFNPDPYPEQKLFYRSDNATLAKLGVPAHSISTDEIDKDQFYHTVNDEVETLDLTNMTAVIKGIAVASKTIVSGEDTPTRLALP